VSAPSATQISRSTMSTPVPLLGAEGRDARGRATQGAVGEQLPGAVVEDAGLRFGGLPPLSLYAHLPWCVRKCPYCDFNSHEARGALPDSEYVEALLRDLRTELPLARGRPIDTIFLGGGTPSLFSGGAIARLLDGVRAELGLAPHAEITLEANPGAVDASSFAAFKDAGVNRLSIGIQSFRNEQLRALGRVHGDAEAEAAVATARAAGFTDLNLDLMYGLPGDTVAGAVADLERAVALSPTHISWYQLTLEPNTAFERRPPALPDDGMVAAIEERGRALLAANGYERYEISAYARLGRRCRHNLNYWQFGDYVGIGAGAHGKLTLPADGEISRRAKTRNPRTYLARAGTAEATSEERVRTRAQAALEYLMNALRLLEGAPVAIFEARAGQPAAAIGSARAAAIARGWLTSEPDRLRATAAGLDRLNRLLELFA
jgi:putative oxygen-independent coproporphyrinogen III oxidase